jgi:hypothetical protein
MAWTPIKRTGMRVVGVTGTLVHITITLSEAPSTPWTARFTSPQAVEIPADVRLPTLLGKSTLSWDVEEEKLVEATAVLDAVIDEANSYYGDVYLPEQAAEARQVAEAQAADIERLARLQQRVDDL